LAVNQYSILNLINVEIAELSDDKDNSVFLNSLHKYWEVALNIRWHLNINGSLELSITSGGSTYFHKVNLLNSIGGLFFTEGENAIFIGRIISRDWDISEASRISFEDLLLFFLSIIELHPCVDVFLIWRI